MRHALLYILLFATSFAIAQPTHLLHKSEVERFDELDSLLHEYAKYGIDKYAKEMYALEEWARENGDKELAYYFDIAQMRHEEYNFNKQVLNHYEQLIEKALKEGYVSIAARTYTYISGKYLAQRKHGFRFEYALKGYELYKDLDPAIYPSRINQQRQLAGAYYSFGKYNEAKFYILDLVKADSTILEKEYGAGLLNTLSLVYLKEAKYDSARSILMKIFLHESKEGRYALMAMAAGNIGDSYYQQNKNDSAIYWFLKEAEIVEKNIPGKLKLNQANSSTTLAVIYYDRGKYKEALRFIYKAREHLNSDKRNNYKIWQELYLRHAQILAAQGKMHDAYIALDSSMKVSHNVAEEYNKSQVVQAEQKIDSVRYELQLAELEHARKTSVIVRNASVGIIILAAVIIILIINRRRLKARQEQEKAALQLDNAQRQLTQYTRNLQEKNKQLQQFSSEIEKLRDEQNDISVNDTILQLQQSTILTDDEWDEFRVMFEKVHSGFIHRLKEKYPDITPAETRYLVLAKLNLDNKEMANILGIGTNAVRNSKFRLRKKFDLPDDEAFDDMVKNI